MEEKKLLVDTKGISGKSFIIKVNINDKIINWFLELHKLDCPTSNIINYSKAIKIIRLNGKHFSLDGCWKDKDLNGKDYLSLKVIGKSLTMYKGFNFETMCNESLVKKEEIINGKTKDFSFTLYENNDLKYYSSIVTVCTNIEQLIIEIKSNKQANLREKALWKKIKKMMSNERVNLIKQKVKQKEIDEILKERAKRERDENNRIEILEKQIKKLKETIN